MSSSDGANETNETSDAARRRRRKSNTLLLSLAVGFLIFGAAAGALYYALQPVTLRIAVGPAGSDDHKVIQAKAEAFASESRTVRLSPITTDGAVAALTLLGAGKAELAVGRGDLEMPTDAQTVAIVRKNFVVLWAPSGLGGKSAKRKAARKIKEIANLAGHKVGVIGRTPANVALLRLDYDAGHGSGSTRAQHQEELADMWSFILWRTGDPAFQPGFDFDRSGSINNTDFGAFRNRLGRSVVY